MKTKFPPPAPPELVVIVDPKAGIRVRNGQVISIVDAYQADTKTMADLIRTEQAKIRPLYGVSEESLREKTAHTKTMMGVGQRLDLSIFYKVTVPDEKLKSMVPKLRALKVVQSAYVKPGVELTIRDNSIESRGGIELRGGIEPRGVIESRDVLVSDTITENFTQVHLDSVSEGGMGVPCAWAIPGGRGAGVNIIDAEGAWNFSHEDLPENLGDRLGITESEVRDDIGWRNHGTAVLGVLGGDSNTIGITGICPEAFVRTVSVFAHSDGTPSETWGAGAAIIHAADNLSAGDILLLEHHLPGRRANFEAREDQFGYIPIEWWPDNLAAIQYATDRGIIVVEAAGNGRQNLDDPIYNDDPDDEPFPDSWRNPFSRNEIDSKAIVVGAGMPPLGIVTFDTRLADRSREESSNFGSMVDAQGWGDGVVTCGYGGLSSDTDENRFYTSRFNGTSSASAMVAGAIGCLHGILRARGSAPLDPLVLRNLLRRDDLNSPQQIGRFPTDPSLVRIGPRPDLCKLIAHLIPPRPLGFFAVIFSVLKALLRRIFK
jgi:hypothetical protein